ncbi:Response regulator receiver domain-containing protein [Neorhodopirellula lusitana]|uniref:Response regulator receiver domain-containing protein n=1 Tax=Neorhodopirellula lusitana TaxID=445327 RepID=A0ABY1PRT5_9BACT|nr:response regulator [Neorhodopirellula lusitana]SMP41052.1 Response regulator receiver domain-containing protein [Neorhodopirellula lusitana]
MTETKSLALVVDDEPLVRNLTVLALTREGFNCDSANDGAQAALMAAKTNYSVVVTDLKMPNRNGHALAVELLSLEARPAVVVLTGVTEPRIAKDLISRGVDDLVYKPIDYSVFGMKVRAIVDRLALTTVPASSGTSDCDDPAGKGSDVAGQPDQGPGRNIVPKQTNNSQTNSKPTSSAKFAPLTAGKIADRIQSEAFPVCDAAINVFRSASLDDLDASSLSNSISQSDFLSNEIVKLANNPFYNPKGVAIPDLSRAVVQVGQKRVGRLALAATAQAALSIDAPSPLNLRLIWAKGVAAGLAIEIMIEQGGHDAIADGLLMCATMQDSAQVALARLYPTRYQAMIDDCINTGISLSAAEENAFGKELRRIHANVLQASGMNESEIDVILHLRDDEATLSRLPTELQNRVQLVRLAGQVSPAVIGVWDPWDEVTIPNRGVVDLLQLWSIDDVIDKTRTNLHEINFGSVAAASSETNKPTPTELTYCDTASDGFDFLDSVVASIQPKVTRCLNPTAAQGTVLINCVGSRNADIPTMVNATKDANVFVAISHDDQAFYQNLPGSIEFPTSYGAFLNKLMPATS